MSTTALPQPCASLRAPDTLLLRRHLAASAECVWAHLTDSSLRQRWLAAGAMVLEPGRPFELVWHNDDLSTSSSERPAGFPAASRATCTLAGSTPGSLWAGWARLRDGCDQLLPA